MQSEFVFSSESVTSGHPDKLCDRVSDAVVASALIDDGTGRVVAECAISTGIVFLSVRSSANLTVDVSQVARTAIEEVGYVDTPFNARSCTVMTSLIDARGPDSKLTHAEALADDELEDVRATEQATVFGFACTHTPAFMPLPIWLAHKISRRLEQVRAEGTLPYLTPDGKTRVAVEFRRREPVRIDGISVVASQQDGERPTLSRLQEDLRAHVITPAFADEPISPDATTRFALNPDGVVVGGGPHLHAGLTGRKGGADTYGEFSRRSDSALSGKDPLRVERIGAYAARHAAKNVVAAELAAQCEVQLSYAHGLAQPVSIHVETYGTARVGDDEIARRLRQVLDFRVAGIARRFDLNRLDPAIYPRLSSYGHFGRTELDLPWERLDRVDALRGA